MRTCGYNGKVYQVEKQAFTRGKLVLVPAHGVIQKQAFTRGKSVLVPVHGVTVTRIFHRKQC